MRNPKQPQAYRHPSKTAAQSAMSQTSASTHIVKMVGAEEVEPPALSRKTFRRGFQGRRPKIRSHIWHLAPLPPPSEA